MAAVSARHMARYLFRAIIQFGACAHARIKSVCVRLKSNAFFLLLLSCRCRVWIHLLCVLAGHMLVLFCCLFKLKIVWAEGVFFFFKYFYFVQLPGYFIPERCVRAELQCSDDGTQCAQCARRSANGPGINNVFHTQRSHTRTHAERSARASAYFAEAD